jgi:hypothetical protein
MLALAALPFSGCRLEDVVKIQAPVEVQRALGVPPRISVSDAERAFESWTATGEELAKRIEHGYEIIGWLNAALGLSFEAAKGALPTAGWAVTLLGMFGTLMIRKPGTDREVSEEKMDSYNKGKRDAEGVFVPLLRELGVKIPSIPPGSP